VEEKICPLCKKNLPLKEFVISKEKKSGRHSYCKPCYAEYGRMWRLKDPTLEKERQCRKKYRASRVEFNMFYCARKRARKLGIPFTIVPDDIHIPTHCPVLGIKLERGIGKVEPWSPSLDRLVPEMGYVPGNIEDGSLEDLESIVKWMKGRLHKENVT
jgi:hypothetical protein